MKILHKNDNIIAVFDEAETLATKKYYQDAKNNNFKDIDIMPVLNAIAKENETLTPTIADLETVPYKYGGKFTGKIIGKGTLLGSAQFCGHERIVLTAAHCVHDGKNFYSDFVFKKGYAKGESTDFFVQAIGVKAAWKGNNYEYDYAFVIVNDKFEKDFYLKLDTDFEIGQKVTSFGYPYNYLDGEVMHTVSGVAEEHYNGKIIMPGNPFKESCSGGAWAVEDRVVGLNSVRTNNEEVLSPILNDATRSLLDDMIKLI